MIVNWNIDYKSIQGWETMIETERLIIRPVKMADYDDICEYGCDEDTGKYMMYWPKTQEQIYKFIHDCIAVMSMDAKIWNEYAIQLKDESKVIGNITLEVKETAAEIGWISNKKYWNCGYMSEAVHAVIEYAFSHFNVDYIFATCNDKNVASYRVMEKCNMIKIKTENSIRTNKNGSEMVYNRLVYCTKR